MLFELVTRKYCSTDSVSLNHNPLFVVVPLNPQMYIALIFNDSQPILISFISSSISVILMQPMMKTMIYKKLRYTPSGCKICRGN